MKGSNMQKGKIIVLAACLAALISSANAASLVHRYDFNTTNDTVGTANGTLVGTAVLDSGALVTAGGNGAVDGKWDLNNARMTLDPSAVSGITGAFTIEDWFTATTGWPKYDSCYAFSDNTNANYLLATPVRGYGPWPSGVGFVGAGGLARDQITTWDMVLEGIYLDTPGVHQTVLTYDGSAFSYYVDGVLSTYGSGGGPISDPGFNLSTLQYIGINGGSPYDDPILSGSTYDFRIYSGAISADQVASVYALGSDASTSAINVAVPEPATCVMLLIAAALGLLYKRNRK
jgi:hypothetical protein